MGITTGDILMGKYINGFCVTVASMSYPYATIKVISDLTNTYKVGKNITVQVKILKENYIKLTPEEWMQILLEQ